MPALIAPLPQIWNLVSIELWHLAPSWAYAWWKAVMLSADPEVVALRETWLTWRGTAADLADTLERDWTPPVMVQCLERLVQEGRMPRAVSSRLEDALLQRVRPDGAWK